MWFGFFGQNSVVFSTQRLSGQVVSGGLSNLLHTMAKYTFLTVGFIAKYAGEGKYHVV